ncbi:MAG: peptidylprolyl isomerase [Candidatus Nanoarchaeia archaeon]
MRKRTKKRLKHEKKHKAEKLSRQRSKHIYSGAGIIGAVIIIAVIAFLVKCPGGVCKASDAKNAMNDGENIVAEFNGGKISSAELEKEVDLVMFLQGMPKSYSSLVPRRKLLNQTIIQELIYQEALDNGYSPDVKGTEELFKESLEKSGRGLSDLMDELKNESFDYDYLIEFNAKLKVISQFINDSILSKIEIGEGSALSFYNDNKEQFKAKEQIRASHILVNTSEEAKDIIGRLDKGEDFAGLARERSIGPSAPKGGDLGYFSRGMMVPEFEDAAFALNKAGDYTPKPVKTQFGFHIIKLTGRREARQLTFDEVKDQVKKGLVQQKQNEAVIVYINKLMSDADIKIYLKEDTAKEKPEQSTP